MSLNKNLAVLTILSLSLLLFSANSFAASIKEAPFYTPPFIQKTVVSKLPLLKGTEIEVMILKLQEDEHFLLIKCNQPCNSAVKIKDWSTCCYPDQKSEFVTIRENAVHYFWIHNVKTGDAIPVASLNLDGTNTHVVFKSGSEVNIRLFGDTS